MTQYLPFIEKVLLPVSIFVLSESLPFIKSTKANGILHAIVLIGKALAAKLGAGEAKIEEVK
jgi:hypothetical protein